MASPQSKTRSADALVGLWTVALTAFIVAALYIARDLLIPLSLAALLTFLLAPLVSGLERWLGRICAVLLVVTLIFSATGAAGWVLTRQLVDLATKLPDYKENISVKLRSIKTPSGGAFTKLSETVEELKKELPGSDAPLVSQVPNKPGTTQAVRPEATPTSVRVLETTKANPFELVQLIIAPILGPLGTGALVLLLVICMLCNGKICAAG